MEKTNKQASEIRVKLKVMEAGNKKLAADKPEDGDVKIRQTQVRLRYFRLVAALCHFQKGCSYYPHHDMGY